MLLFDKIQTLIIALTILHDILQLGSVVYMQYILCPRCQFKASVKTNVCTTCGFQVKEYLNKIAKETPTNNESESPITKIFNKILPKPHNGKPDEENHVLS